MKTWVSKVKGRFKNKMATTEDFPSFIDVVIYSINNERKSIYAFNSKGRKWLQKKCT